MTETKKVKDFAVGQVWVYQTRRGEEPSRLQICKIETNEKFGLIFHLTIRDVMIQNYGKTGGFTRQIAHVPVTLAALEASTIERVMTLPVNDDYLAGYTKWQTVFATGDATVCTQPIADIVGMIEAALKDTPTATPVAISAVTALVTP